VALGNRFPVICYYGKDDADDSLCTGKGLPTWVTVHGEAGGHHFNEGYQRLAEQMIDGLPVSKVPALPAQRVLPAAASAVVPASAASAAPSASLAREAGHH
jgi:hypothetical protein